MVFPVRHGGVLLVPDEEGCSECVLVGLLILVLLTGRHQDDYSARRPNFDILVIRQRHLSFYGKGR